MQWVRIVLCEWDPHTGAPDRVPCETIFYTESVDLDSVRSAIAATARFSSPVVIILNDFLLRECVISSFISVRCLFASKTWRDGVAHYLSSFQFGCLQCNKLYDRLLNAVS